MKINLFFRALSICALFSAPHFFAQNYQTMPVQSGYTADVIANGIGSSIASTTTDVDGVSFAFVARDFQLTSSSTLLNYGIPTNGIINSVVAATPGLSYQLGSLSTNNSLRLVNNGEAGTLVFAAPKAAVKLYMLSTSGSGTSTVNVTVNFADNTTQVFTGTSLSDWYGGVNYAIQGIGRINRTNDVLESNSSNPRLYQSVFNIDAVNQAKPIQSVTVSKTAGSGIPNVFAFSADAYSDCGVPILNAVGTVMANSAQVSWTVPATTQATGFDIYYNTTNTAPNGGTTPSLTGITGTSTTMGQLIPSTIYYYWVRTNCSSATSQSVWSFSGTFKTACGDVPTLFENFDTYGTGNIVPDCWIRMSGTGSQTISTSTPASGARNIFQTTSASATPVTVVMPVFSNINAGTHKLRLKARVTSQPGTLNVGYVTNTSDANSFVLLQALAITNTSYTAANAEYIVQVPSSVPANARIAIRSANDGKSYYWDDVSWEAATLGTQETNAQKALSVYPNPFGDALYISDVKNVKSVAVSDVSGRVVKIFDIPTKELNLTTLNSGLYFVTLYFKDGSQSTIKAVKK